MELDQIHTIFGLVLVFGSKITKNYMLLGVPFLIQSKEQTRQNLREKMTRALMNESERVALHVNKTVKF